MTTIAEIVTEIKIILNLCLLFKLCVVKQKIKCVLILVYSTQGEGNILRLYAHELVSVII